MALVAHRASAAAACRAATSATTTPRATTSSKLYLLEINTQPGMTALSLVPEQAKHLGISYPELVSWMVEHAACDA